MRKETMGGWAIAMVLIGTVCVCRSIREIEGQVKVMVGGFLGESIALSIPFNKCYKVEAEFKDNEKFIEFKPSGVSLRVIKNCSLQKISSNLTVFEELRSPIKLKRRLLLVLKDYLIIFTRPNVVLIVEESDNGFIIRNRYQLPHFYVFDQLNLYKMGQKGILTILNKTQIYQLGLLGYNIYTLPQPSAIVHLQQSPHSGQFFVVQFMKGLSLYKLSVNDKIVHVIKRYEGANLGLSTDFTYITDISTKFYKSEGLLYVLDFQIGLVQLNMSQLFKSKLVIRHKRCQSFDSIGRSNFVLLCQFQGSSVLVRVIREYDSKLKSINYRQLKPISLGSYLSHILATQSYYLVYSQRKINIVWNTQRAELQQSWNTVNEINFGQLQSMLLSGQNGDERIYTIEGGILYKYEIIEKEAELVLKSDFPVIKVFKIYLYGNCEQLQMQQIQIDGVETCRVQNRVLFRVTEKGDGVQEFSINASIIVILITVFLLTIWICLKKYKGLQREATRVMENYQRSKMNGQKCKV